MNLQELTRALRRRDIAPAEQPPVKLDPELLRLHREQGDPIYGVPQDPRQIPPRFHPRPKPFNDTV